MLLLTTLHVHDAPSVVATVTVVAAVFVVLLLAIRQYANAKARRVSLPVLRELEAMKRCETCASWDRDLFRKEIAKHPAFVGAAEVVSPAEMIAGYRYDEEGQRVGVNVDDPHVRHATWDDAGVCIMHDIGTLRVDVCEDWCPRRPSRRPEQP